LIGFPTSKLSVKSRLQRASSIPANPVAQIWIEFDGPEMQDAEEAASDFVVAIVVHVSPTWEDFGGAVITFISTQPNRTGGPLATGALNIIAAHSKMTPENGDLFCEGAKEPLIAA
jgi:hypothetical protein